MVLVLALGAGCQRCGSSPPDAGFPAPAPPPPPSGAPATGAAPQSDAGPGTPLRVDVPKPPPPPWEGPETPADLKALDGYRGFSGDGLVFAYAQYSAGAGLPVFSFLSATTNTVEKTTALHNAQTRREVLKELRDDGYPRPGREPRVPPVVGAVAREGLVYATFSGIPAAKPFRPFEGMPAASIGSVSVVAVSRDGKHAAVRVAAEKAGTEFGPPVEYHVVTLFE